MAEKTMAVLAALGLFALSALLGVIGVAAPGWFTVDDAVYNGEKVTFKIGLWDTCIPTSAALRNTALDSKLVSTSALGVMGLVFLFLGGTVLILFMCLDVLNKNSKVAVAMAVFFILSTLFSLIAMGVFIGEYNSDLKKKFGDKLSLSYAFVFTILSAIVALPAAILSGIEVCNVRSRQHPRSTRVPSNDAL